MPTTTLALPPPPPPPHTSPSPPILEQNGHHTALILHLPPQPSLLIFPTHITPPQDPRGYLQIPLSLPAAIISLTYNATTTIITSPSLTLTLTLSPTHPSFHLLYAYTPPLRPPTPSTHALLFHSPSLSIHRFETCPTPCLLQVTITLSKHPPSRLHSISARQLLVDKWTNTVKVSCPHPALSTMLSFANVRLCEAVFHAPESGLLHSPGGAMFYCGVWANDQVEYAAPALALFGCDERRVLLNSFCALARYFDRATNTVAYSVEVDAGYVGRLDRGDAAMLAWGASLFSLLTGAPVFASPAHPHPLHHLHFLAAVLERKLETAPVIYSASDELEGRFETGHANLAVNCLAVLALDAAAQVVTHAGEHRISTRYESAASQLRDAARKEFWVGADKGYVYYKGCQHARGWACLPAMAGLRGGIGALQYVLRELWVDDGVLVSSASPEVWDRCTLYAIRAAFQVGLVEEAMEKLILYVSRRNNGRHSIPVAVENNKSHAQLSSESGLLIRVITEGLLGMKPRAGRTIVLTPRCPNDWEAYSVESVFYLDACLDFRVEQTEMGMRLEVTSREVTTAVEFANGTDVSMHVPPRGSGLRLSVTG